MAQTKSSYTPIRDTQCDICFILFDGRHYNRHYHGLRVCMWCHGRYRKRIARIVAWLLQLSDFDIEPDDQQELQELIGTAKKIFEEDWKDRQHRW